MQNRTLFRSLLLLAGLHYSWNTGHLREYEATYLLHRIESLRAINDFIKDTNRDPRELRAQLGVIATLCLTDVSLALSIQVMAKPFQFLTLYEG